MKSSFYLWANGLVGQIIEGASDAFLSVMGGSTAAQFANAQMPATTPKQLLLSMAVLSGIYAASYLKKNPLPSVSSEQRVASSAHVGGPIEPPVPWPRTSPAPSFSSVSEFQINPASTAP